MSDIGKAMEKKGYIPLRDDGKGAIGFRPSPGRDNRRLSAAVWFDTGLKMNDGTPRTVCAHDEAQRHEYINKGWKPAGPGKGPLAAGGNKAGLSK
ncbi:MAG: hypothetical protein HY883_04740 [Deltaproteobacteria bacterium]|nr:hypothetical protein [Deltaproteobacteria bacterium]